MATAFTTTLDHDNNALVGFSLRSAATLSVGGTKARVTFQASSTAGLQADNCSIGIRLSGGQTTATPVELKFGGASGFTLSAGQSITSDFATLATATSDVVIVIIDAHTSGTQGMRNLASAVAGSFYKMAPTYNSANPAGLTTNASESYFSFTSIEVGTNAILAANPGTYAVTGFAAFIGRFYVLAALAGSYALTGFAAKGKRGIRILSAAGSYALTGVAARTGRGIRLISASGSYALTGAAIRGRLAWRILTGVGSYSITGITLILAELIAPANKFKHRVSKFVLQKLRQRPPTLSD